MKLGAGWIVYGAMVLTTASARAVSEDRRRSDNDCSDGAGHGPDPGSTECIHAIEQGQAMALDVAEISFIGIMLMGLLLGGLALALRLFYRRVVLRFIPDGL